MVVPRNTAVKRVGSGTRLPGLVGWSEFVFQLCLSLPCDCSHVI